MKEKKYIIPNVGTLKISTILFDINGTLQFQGKVSAQLIKLFKRLKMEFNVILISSDTRGNLKNIANKLGTTYIRINPENQTDTEAKNMELIRIGKEHTIAVGNGRNDALMLKNAALGILILGSEGASTKSLLNSDIVFTNPIDAIHFLLDEKAVVATLRR
ncbi:MAG: putative Haloacid dehalogenase [Promethearchaeota archaeon]|nr:MAG: putative Haloacid dehalogenase [Candidatus Lokiarchaeota archaeon]